jgi:uncharacterized protein YeaO (DUF488 family)
MGIQVKRVYDPPADSDGVRILVDRLWPRGLSKEAAQLDLWLKDVGPSDELREWFNHEPDRWPEFQRRYFAELAGKSTLLQEIREKARVGKVTLLFGARNKEMNQAVALKQYLEGSSVRAAEVARQSQC